MLKKVFCFGVFILMGLCFLSGCEKEMEKTDLAGDSYRGGNPASTYYCGYRADTKEFDIDNVELDFYYYTHLSDPSRYDCIGYTITLKTYFSTSKIDETYDIKTFTPEEFFADGYELKSIVIGEKTIEVRMHYEKIRIPSELFSQETGYVLFICTEMWEYPDGDIQRGDGSYASVFYEKKENKIILSNKVD